MADSWIPAFAGMTLGASVALLSSLLGEAAERRRICWWWRAIHRSLASVVPHRQESRARRPCLPPSPRSNRQGDHARQIAANESLPAYGAPARRGNSRPPARRRLRQRRRRRCLESGRPRRAVRNGGPACASARARRHACTRGPAVAAARTRRPASTRRHAPSADTRGPASTSARAGPTRPRTRGGTRAHSRAGLRRDADLRPRGRDQPGLEPGDHPVRRGLPHRDARHLRPAHHRRPVRRARALPAGVLHGQRRLHRVEVEDAPRRHLPRRCARRRRRPRHPLRQPEVGNAHEPADAPLGELDGHRRPDRGSAGHRPPRRPARAPRRADGLPGRTQPVRRPRRGRQARRHRSVRLHVLDARQGAGGGPQPRLLEDRRRGTPAPLPGPGRVPPHRRLRRPRPGPAGRRPGHPSPQLPSRRPGEQGALQGGGGGQLLPDHLHDAQRRGAAVRRHRRPPGGGALHRLRHLQPAAGRRQRSCRQRSLRAEHARLPGRERVPCLRPRGGARPVGPAGRPGHR